MKADLTYTPDAIPQWRHDVRFEVKDARFEHPDLPWPVEKIAAIVRSVDGQREGRGRDRADRTGEGAAVAGNAQRRHRRRRRPAGPTRRPAAPVRGRGSSELEISAAGVALDDNLFEHLPETAEARQRKLFSPTGQVDLGYKFTREARGLEARAGGAPEADRR